MHCLTLLHAHCNNFEKCACSKDSKVPVIEREFLVDQRKVRRMIIGSIDKETAAKTVKKAERNLKRQRYYAEKQT